MLRTAVVVGFVVGGEHASSSWTGEIGTIEDLERSAVIPAETEGMTSWVSYHTNIFLRLMVHQGRPESDGLSDRRIEVAHLEVEMHYRPLGPFRRRQDWGLVPDRLLEYDENWPLGRGENGRSRLLVPDGPAKQL